MNTATRSSKLAVIIMLSLLVTSSAYALGMDQGKVISMTGDAQYQKSGLPSWLKLEVGTVLSQGDAVKTDPNCEVVMELTGDKKTAEITIRKNSKFVFKTFQHDEDTKVDTTLLDVSMGAVLVKAEKLAGASKFEVKTPTSIVGIRGTTFEVKVEKK